MTDILPKIKFFFTTKQAPPPAEYQMIFYHLSSTFLIARNAQLRLLKVTKYMYFGGVSVFTILLRTLMINNRHDNYLKC